jgi:hypothetical protein
LQHELFCKYNHSLYSFIVGFTGHVRFVQRLPDLSWPGSFDFIGMHIKQFTVPPQNLHWPMGFKGCLRVLHIDILTLTQDVALYTQYCTESSHAP